MPISREEFDRGVIDLVFPVVRLLQSRPGDAFTPEEVRQMLLEREDRSSPLDEVERSLDILASQGRVVRKEIGGQRWYTVVRRSLGFVREQG